MFFPTADAAEFQRHVFTLIEPNELSIVVNGRIEKGDYDRLIANLKEALEIIQESNGKLSFQAVSLNSEGGDVKEAMRIGVAIRDMRLGTNIGYYDSAKCMSACFFVLVGGITRSGPHTFPTGTTQVLGIHRPFFEKEYYASQSVKDAEKQYAALQEASRKYLLDMGVSESLIHQMFAVPSSQIRLVNEQEFKQEIGNPAFFEEWVIAKCGAQPEYMPHDEYGALVAYYMDKELGIVSKLPLIYIDYLQKKSDEIERKWNVYAECNRQSRGVDQLNSIKQYLNSK